MRHKSFWFFFLFFALEFFSSHHVLALTEFGRNNVFNAKNFFDLPGLAPPFHENQFGGTLGGPVVKESTFFFVNYEGQRTRDSLADLFSVPTMAERSGNFAGVATIFDP